jgi:hypothetical protein
MAAALSYQDLTSAAFFKEKQKEMLHLKSRKWLISCTETAEDSIRNNVQKLECDLTIEI